MKHVRREIALAACLGAMWANACTPSGEPGGTTSADSAGILVTTHRLPSPGDLPVFAALGEESTVVGGADLGFVRGARLTARGEVVVADATYANVRVFDTDGGLLRTIGRKGEGPGEFLYPLLVGLLPGDSIVVYDARTRRLSVFTAEGAPARQAGVPGEMGPFAAPLGLLPGGESAYSGSIGIRLTDSERFFQDTVPVLVLRRTGDFSAEFALTPTQGIFEAAPGSRPRVMNVPFVEGARLSAGLSGIFVASPDQFELRRYLPTGELATIIRIDALRTEVRSADVDSIAEAEAAGLGGDEAEIAVRSLMRRMPIPDHKPPFKQVVVDHSGSLWVRLIQANGSMPWLVFDPDGGLRGGVDLPEGEVVDITDNAILVLKADEFGAQILVAYSLRAG